jgi:F0F1-type ATP synthase membrane subunit b/b'
MENIDKIFRFVEENGIGFNSDILEAGLLNIIGLIAIVVFVGKDILGSALEERETAVGQSIQDAENRLNEAQKRLNEAQKQMLQLSVIINDIKNDTLVTKKNMLEVDATEAKTDLKFRFERALFSFKSKERQIFFEIKEQMTYLVITRTVRRVKQAFAKRQVAEELINNTILTLELPS